MQTEMTEGTDTSAEQDKSAVAAVRSGDAERYRELVERHERRVFAVAWSRLGDATLAEEAAQEAFIRGYRRLWLLGDGAKFSSWISTIVRRVAINFGIRHRRELNKRERWALERSGEVEEKSSDGNPPCTPETLRQTLAELPAAHRECLVLFYLEGRSGAEAAAALGISESALRVRLHRARAAMRQQLESRLEGSLEKLRPAKSLVPAVMLAVLASSSAKAAAAGGGTVAAGIGAKVLSVAGKSFLFAWLVPLISLTTALPGLVLATWIGRVERRNYRDPEGFRAKLHHGFFRSFLWGFPLLILIVFGFNHAIMAAGGLGAAQVFAACLVALMVLVAARSLVIFRNPFQIGMFAYTVVILVGLAAVALGWIPMAMASLPALMGSVVLLFVVKYRPVRMDYNLFLRATQGMLKVSERAEEMPLSQPLTRGAVLAFARFLGSRWLAGNFRWTQRGLMLRLIPAKANFARNMGGAFMPPGARCSHIFLGWDGTVRAHCDESDAAALISLAPDRACNIPELEGIVAEAVGSAWREFREGNPATAERLLGEVPEQEVFIVSPRRSAATRWWQFAMIAAIALMVAAMSLGQLQPASLAGLRPVSITEQQVRAFVNDTTPNPDPKKLKTNGASMALFTCLVLPQTNLFTPERFRELRDEIAGGDGFEKLKTMPSRAQSVIFVPLPRRAFADGWVTCADLDIQLKDVTDSFRGIWPRSRPLSSWDYFLARGESWSWVKKERFNVMRITSGGLTELRVLRVAGCLDLVDREKLIKQIASVQVLSATPSPGEPPIHDWTDVRGLFFTPCWPALQDTWCSLAALEILGGLDKIDRGECIRGILHMHRGGGYFVSPNSGGFNEYHIKGDAKDTIAAYESLRILGALDRVKDLSEWKFRPSKIGVSKGQTTWSDVEAWVCKQRLEKILREHKDNPSAPYRSLLEP